MNIYYAYEINLWSCRQGTDFTLGNSLFDAAKLTKIAGPDKYFYFGYSIEFNVSVSFSLSNGSEFRKILITFGANMCILIKKEKCFDSW